MCWVVSLCDVLIPLQTFFSHSSCYVTVSPRVFVFSFPYRNIFSLEFLWHFIPVVRQVWTTSSGWVEWRCRGLRVKTKLTFICMGIWTERTLMWVGSLFLRCGLLSRSGLAPAVVSLQSWEGAGWCYKEA